MLKKTKACKQVRMQGNVVWIFQEFLHTQVLINPVHCTLRFYAISSSFDKFSNKDKTLAVQFTVKHEQSIDCGGGYVKIFPSTVDSKKMTGDSEYNIMFG